MTASGLQVRVGGVWLSTIAPWSELIVTHQRRGSWECTWNMPLGNKLQRPPSLVRSAPVDVFLGAEPVWSGALTEPNWAEGTFAAIGACREAEGAVALTSAGRPTTKPDTAITQAIARGVCNWSPFGGWGFSTPIAGGDGGALPGGADDPEGVKLFDLLDAATAGEQVEWMVDTRRGLIQYAPLESEPDWLIVPGSGVLGVADDQRVDRVILMFLDSSDGGKRRAATYPASTPAGGIEKRASITRWGSITPAAAADYAEGIWRRLNEGRDGWTNGLDLADGQILTMGGQRANLAHVRGGQVMRLLGVPDPRGTAANTDVVIEETVWRTEERRIQVNPVGLVERTFEGVLKRVLPSPPGGGAERLHFD